jgi:hypothetical protein
MNEGVYVQYTKLKIPPSSHFALCLSIWHVSPSLNNTQCELKSYIMTLVCGDCYQGIQG